MAGEVTPCPKCGSVKEPKCEMEVMEDGSLGAGVVWICPDCGAVEV